MRREVLRAGSETHLNLPCRTVDILGGGGEIACAAVAVLAHEPVDRRCGRGGVSGNAEIELYAARTPRTAKRYIAELHDVVVVQERLAGNLVHGAPHFAADFRKHCDPDLLVLKNDGLPLLRYGLGDRSVKAKIRIKRRIGVSHGIGIGKSIRRKLQFRYFVFYASESTKCRQRDRKRN